jgi:ABC-type dipeptide/oligopeptide/nickel transport system permease subunit
VFIGGIVGAVLSALPILGGGNICCCLWYALGGVIAVLIYRGGSSLGIGTGVGALLGFVSGFITGILSSCTQVFLFLHQVPESKFPQWKDDAINQLRQMASTDQYANMKDIFNTYIDIISNLSYETFVTYVIMVFASIAVIGIIVAMIAGTITAAVAGKKQAHLEEPPPYKPM